MPEDPAVKAARVAPYSWKPGQSGNPKGYHQRKPFLEELKRQLGLEPEGDCVALMEIVQAVIKKAKEGDPKACFEIRDMLDGKPVQQISGPDGGAIPMTFEDANEKLRELFDELKLQQEKANGQHAQLEENFKACRQ